MSERLLLRKHLLNKVSFSYTTIWRLERKGLFPARRLISPGRVAWLESEVDKWISERSKVGGGA